MGKKATIITLTPEDRSYLELQTRLPDSLAPLDPKIRSLVRDSVTRGKTDLTIQIHKSKDANPNLTWDRGTAGFYYQAAKEIVEAVKNSGAQVSGPIPMPTKIEKVTILRAVHKYKDSREQFEQRTHKRLIDVIAPTQKTIEVLRKMDISAGVYVNMRTK